MRRSLSRGGIFRSLARFCANTRGDSRTLALMDARSNADAYSRIAKISRPLAPVFARYANPSPRVNQSPAVLPESRNCKLSPALPLTPDADARANFPARASSDKMPILKCPKRSGGRSARLSDGRAVFKNYKNKSSDRLAAQMTERLCWHSRRFKTDGSAAQVECVIYDGHR